MFPLLGSPFLLSFPLCTPSKFALVAGARQRERSPIWLQRAYAKLVLAKPGTRLKSWKSPIQWSDQANGESLGEKIPQRALKLGTQGFTDARASLGDTPMMAAYRIRLAW